MTKREIAQLMKVSEATLQRWKSGDSFPELPNIEKLSLVLGVSTMEFYRSEEAAPARTEPVSLILSRLQAIPDEFYEKALALTKDDKEAWAVIITVLEEEIKIKEKKSAEKLKKASGSSQ